jgi:hypothetical protein
VPVPGDYRPAGEASEVVSGSGVDPGVVAVVLR